jgi:hypothetical protein
MKPSSAIATLLDSQRSIFGSANVEELSLLLNHLDPTGLDALTTHADVEIKVNQVAEKVMKKVVANTGFDLDWSMLDCRNDKTMAETMANFDVLEVEDCKKVTAQLAMKLVLVLVEKHWVDLWWIGHLCMFECSHCNFGKVARMFAEVPLHWVGKRQDCSIRPIKWRITASPRDVNAV